MAAARRVSLPPCGARAAPSRRRGWRGAPGGRVWLVGWGRWVRSPGARGSAPYRQRQPASSLRLPPGVRLSHPPPPPASPPPPVTADQTPRPPAAPARASRRRPVAAEAASSRLQRRPSQRIEVWVRIALWSPPRPTAAGAGLASSSLRRRPRQAQRLSQRCAARSRGGRKRRRRGGAPPSRSGRALRMSRTVTAAAKLWSSPSRAALVTADAAPLNSSASCIVAIAAAIGGALGGAGSTHGTTTPLMQRPCHSHICAVPRDNSSLTSRGPAASPPPAQPPPGAEASGGVVLDARKRAEPERVAPRVRRSLAPRVAPGHAAPAEGACATPPLHPVVLVAKEPPLQRRRRWWRVWR